MGRKVTAILVVKLADYIGRVAPAALYIARLAPLLFQKVLLPLGVRVQKLRRIPEACSGA